MRILLTGNQGYIGAILVPRLWVMEQSLGEISASKTASVRTEANYFLAEVI